MDVDDDLKARLLKARLPEGTYEIPGVGMVRYRALTRGEGLELRGRELAVAEAEQELLSRALIDPRLTVDEVRQWQEISPAGELEPLTQRIAKLSGMVQEAPKSGLPDVRD